MFYLLVISLPTENGSLRMRAWRAIKSAGAAQLRDGAYLLPDHGGGKDLFEKLAVEVADNGGTSFVLSIDDRERPDLVALFDRTKDYEELASEISAALTTLSQTTAKGVLKSRRKWQKAFDAIQSIDYFPGEAQLQVAFSLREVEEKAANLLTPGEPTPVDRDIVRLNPVNYRGRTWATRRRPWVDRLASAWLIKRFIDPQATISWLVSPNDAGPEVLGFDFDGAEFTHVGSRVTFEVLAATFGITSDAMRKLGAIVHFLDVGGLQPAEATGVESILKGLRERISDDDRLLEAASLLFDGLYTAFGGVSDVNP